MSKEDTKEVPEGFGNEMENSMRNDARILFKKALQTYRSENEIAKFLGNSFHVKYKGKWHCIVGKDFGSAVIYEQKNHFCEQIGQFYVELWRCGK